MEKEPDSTVALLDSTYYLGLTAIPVKSRYGESSVLYNHKTKMLTFMDKNGVAYLEPGSICTVESASSELARQSAFGEDPRSVNDTNSEKSFFKAPLVRSTSANSAKKSNVGILPRFHVEVGKQTTKAPEAPHPSARSPEAPSSSREKRISFNAGLRAKSEKDITSPLKAAVAKRKSLKEQRSGSNGHTKDSTTSIKEEGNGDDSEVEDDEVFDLIDMLSKPPPARQNGESNKSNTSESSDSEEHVPIAVSRTNSFRATRKFSDQDLTTPPPLPPKPAHMAISVKKKRESLSEDNLASPVDRDESDSEVDLMEMLGKSPPFSTSNAKKTALLSLMSSEDSSPQTQFMQARKGSFVGSIAESIKKEHGRKGSLIDFMLKTSPSGDFKHAEEMSHAHSTTNVKQLHLSSENKPMNTIAKSLSTLQLQKSLFKSMDNVIQKDKTDDIIFSGYLRTVVINGEEEYLVKVDESNLYICQGNDADVIFEMSLRKTLSKVNRKEKEYSFTIIGPASEVHFVASSYAIMINWIAVLNSVSSFLAGELKMALEVKEMHIEMFDREYHAILSLIETSESPMFVDPNFEVQLHNQRLSVSLDSFPAWQSVSETDSVKYESESISPISPKSGRTFAGLTFDKLVEVLTDLYPADQSFSNLIIHSFRCFTDTNTLLSKMISRMNTKVDYGDVESVNSTPIIRLRAISFVLRWMTTLWSVDFQRYEIKQLLGIFFAVMSSSFDNDHQNIQLAEFYLKKFINIKNSLKNRIPTLLHLQSIGSYHTETSSLRASTIRSSRDRTEKKNSGSILEIEADDLVTALTMQDEEGLQKISTLSLLMHIWESQKDPMVSQLVTPITEMVENFNQMSFWVATEICTQPEIKNRVKIVEKMIKIANHCLKLNNYNTTLAIVSGLNLVSVSRLKATWELVEPKKMKQLHALEDLMSPVGNYKAYRTIYEERDQSKPSIPVLSLLLKDLLFANDGNPTYLNNPEDKAMRLINISKLKSIYGRISQFTAASQLKSYVMERTHSVVAAEDYCSSLRALKEQALYKYSCLCEPKSGDDVLRLRAKWMSS